MAEATIRVPPRSDDELPTVTDEAMYEILGGQRVEMTAMSAYAMVVGTEIVGHIAPHVRQHKLGRVAGETLFRLPIRKTGQNRRPDVAFVSNERWPPEKPMEFLGNAWDVVPDLAIEVVSPYDLIRELKNKVREYFKAGVREVWVVDPGTREVEVLKSPKDVTVYAAEDAIGSDLLPGFQVQVAAFFPPSLPPPEVPDDE